MEEGISQRSGRIVLVKMGGPLAFAFLVVASIHFGNGNHYRRLLCL